MSTYREITFSDDDVVNQDNCIYAGEYNPHKVRPWLLHDHGLVLAVVFADCEQDAIDEAVDADKLDRFLITDVDRADYDEDDEHIAYLGNASEQFDIESLGIIELPTPKRSFCAQFDASTTSKVRSVS